MNWLLAGVLAYVALQVVFGFAVSRRIATEDDYLVAGRRMGPGLAVFSVFATWFGAETCTGSAGQAYHGGLRETTADPFGYALCLVLMALVFAAPLWRRRLTTLADLFRQRYGPWVERLAVLLMATTSLLWAAAQVRAFGQVLSAVSDLDVEVSVTLAAVVVVIYTATGGLLADAVSDVLQGGVLILGLGLLAAAFLGSSDAGALRGLDPARLDLFPTGRPLLDTLESWSVPILGSVVAQELVARVSAARSAEVARGATLAAAGLYLSVGLLPVGLGLAASVVLPGLEDPEQALVQFALRYLPAGLFVVFAGALVSAILSTVDSALLVSGSLVAHNVVLPLLGQPTEKGRLLANRVAVVTAGVVAWGLALEGVRVYEMVEEASGLGSAGLLVVLGFALHTRFGGAWSAAAALVAGLAAYVGAAHVAQDARHPFLGSLAATLGAYVLVGLVELGLGRATARAATQDATIP
ncbi:MAG: sodium:solute symporter family protein [Planctomycetes bacterium]|nr:sodium:solute symporter family protein [Planctomycetota bacterium]